MSKLSRLAAVASFGVAAMVTPATVWAAPKPKSKPKIETVVYVVRRGDTLYDLASNYMLRTSDYAVVQRRNRIANPRRLPIGAKLEIPVALLRTTPTEARVASYRGEASATVQGRTIAVTRGMMLPEGSIVTTGPNASVRLALNDGSQVALPSQSRIRIDVLRHTPLTDSVERTFSLEAGRSEATVKPMTKPRDGFTIRTPLSVTAVRGTVFRVIYDAQAERAWTEVVDGTVNVASAVVDHSASVTPEAFGVKASHQGVTAPAPLLPPTTVAAPGRVQDEPEVAFDLTPVPGAAKYRARLGADAGLLDILDEVTVDQPRVSFKDVGNGAMFVQVTALDVDGLEGMPNTYGFSRFRHGLKLSAPTASGKHWLFQWEPEGEGPHAYRFQLSDKPDGVPLMDQAGLSEGRMTVTDLPDGAYYWRVQSVVVRDGQRYEKWSPAQQFRIGG
jgi:hypothetical protein